MTQPSHPLGRIAQIALGVKDVAKSIAFYRDTLGLPLLFEAGGMAFLACGEERLMLGKAQGETPASGEVYIYFDAGDWMRTETALTARGILFDGPTVIVEKKPGEEHALRFFKDPDGHRLAIMGWRKAST